MMGVRLRSLAVLAGMGLLSACGPVIPQVHPPGHRPPPSRPAPSPSAPPPAAPSNQPAPTPPATAITVGVRPGPDIASLGLKDADAQGALVSFRESCPKLLARTDVSGLTRSADWQDACATASAWPLANAAGFFATKFETAIVKDGASYVTGYYEPEIAGVRVRQPGFDVPVYGMPSDLVHAKPGDAPVKSNGQTPFGRYDETGQFQPYYDRAQIEAGIIEGKAPELGWAADPVEFFFLQVQGSGRLRAPDGSVMRIGYIADNGQPYTGIGNVMRKMGLIGTAPGQFPGSMQGIMRYVREHPEDGRALMQQNKSWVFFREITGDGPLGAMGVPVRPHVSLAADPLFVPLGAPVFLSSDGTLAGADIANGLWVAQDTGGAIKGANRFDSFWGAGPDARTIAGGLLARGRAILLLPVGTLARLGAR